MAEEDKKINSGDRRITFLTALKYSSSILKTFNNMTFLYNPLWEYGKTETPTFPITLFYVESMHEIQDSELSMKPMLFYNGANADTSGSTNVNTSLNVVSDNIVTKPVNYALDIILPATLNKYIDLQNYRLDINTMTEALNMLSSGGGADPISGLVRKAVDVCSTGILLLRTLLSMLTSVNFNSSAISDDGFVSDIIGLPFNADYISNSDYNKEAFKAICGSRTILKMKDWKGWRYKYVAVTSYDISKNPDEDGVYRGTVKLTEVPIMTMISERSKGFRSNAWDNPIIMLTNEAIKRFVDDSEV